MATIDVASNSALLAVVEKLAEQNNILNGTTVTLKGETGNGISSIEKTKTEGLVDTYTITFTDGAKTTFTVTNGTDGEQGIQGEKGDKGNQGDDGISATHSWNGTILTVTSASGTSSVDLKGAKGDKGDKGDTGPAGPAGSNGNDGSDGTNGKDGTSVTVTNVSTSTVDGGNNVVTFSDGKTLTVKNGSKGSTGANGIDGSNGKDGKSAYAYAKDGGYKGTEEAFAKKLANGEGANYVTAYGAEGDGETDDTTYFQQALATDRVVFVPGGTYKLTGGLVIRDNCELELAQDAVLVFTQTTGNCITLGMSSSIRGNHATVKVPYEFSGNVVYASSTTTESVLDVPPFSKWDPQWKSGRYVTDLNICKADYRGFHYLVSNHPDYPNDDVCKGTAIYLSADANSHLTFMWGIHYSGIRIAGAFEYGIHAQNFAKTDDPDNLGWLHEMRIDAFITSCETGVCLEDCNNAYVSAVIQPCPALIYDATGKSENKDTECVPYAKHGIKLIRSKNVDLSGSRVWDWNDTNSLWTEGGEYQFLCMYGDCRGAILNAFQYYVTSYDIRDLIYTDTPSNLEQMTILQEPFDRWFKNRDGIPYFSDGHVEKKLTTEDDIEALFGTTMMAKFTNQLPLATDTDGTIYNGTGYMVGANINAYYPPTIATDDPYPMTTGFIPVKDGSTIRTENLFWDKRYDGYEKIVFYDKNKEGIARTTSTTAFITSAQLATSALNLISEYELGENGLKLVLGSNPALDKVAYVRMTFYGGNIGSNPIITVDEEIAYEQVGVLSDGVKIKAENVIGLPEYSDVKITALTTEVATELIDQRLGVIENGTY